MLKAKAHDQNSVSALVQGCVCPQAEHTATREDSQELQRRLTTNKGMASLH